MKKAVFIISILIVNGAFPVLSETDTETILKSVDMYIANKKYLSAFALIEKHDPHNRNVDLLLKQIEIARNYHIATVIHQTFTIADLRPGQKLDDVRLQDGTSGVFYFPINTILENIIRENPNEGRLYRALGDYYFEMQMLYGNTWLYGKDELLEKSEVNYTKAQGLKISDFILSNNMGVIMLERKLYRQAIPYFKQSIAQNNNFGNSHNNCAYAYYMLEEYTKALPYALRSYDMINDALLKGEAAYLIGSLYEKMSKDERALIYYQKAGELIDKNYRYIRAILAIYLKKMDMKEGLFYAERLFSIDPRNLNAASDILSLYGNYGLGNEALDFFNAMERKYLHDDQVCGNICFTRALLHTHFLKNDDEKLKNLRRAKKYFSSVFPDDHKIFDIINREMGE